ncbi:alginate export family protein [Litoribacter alkaliphilus]|uniref:Alginate export family protein n=1 Tax=Litoribacter ruber TaxID=702568 RepID=A0AAP2CJS4_9BACT|nr:alginate export family protein [Litoribacter alkaliphilus]MBS9524486.1 alginate export family protein [Litoribacter alkaliphilus]
MKKWITIGLVMIMILSYYSAMAQFSIDGQYITRGEYRNGFGRPIGEGESPAAFIAHRARLQASYRMDGFNFFMSVQDIRTWGNTTQVKLTDNFLSVHEAWLEADMGPMWKIKLGRQELNYDNARFLGNLDWALQARAHDFALVKYEKEDMKLHFGGGFNQENQFLFETTFVIPNQYKVAQMARYENKYGDFHFSAMFWNDGRQFWTVEDEEFSTTGVDFRQTIGLPTLKYQMGNTTFTGYYYHQLGRDRFGVERRRINAYNVSAQVTQQFDINNEIGRKFRLVGGFEILSGGVDSLTNNAYSPLYGTNHLFNGYMDLFYVGGAHENNVGLQDYFLRGRYDFNERFFLQGDAHLFYSYASVFGPEGGPDPLSNFMGTELDLSFGYVFTDAISLQGGYSQFFHTDTYRAIQGNRNLRDTQNWAYLMMIFRPNMKNKFIGILL